MSKIPVIEITGTGTHNRGAELMADAISQKLRIELGEECKLVVKKTFGPDSALKNYGFYTTWETPTRAHHIIYKVMKKLFPSLAPIGKTEAEKWLMRNSSRLTASRTTVNPEDIDLVLDASGFAFGDQWGAKPARKLLTYLETSARNDKPLVLMPQAFGTFDDPDTAEWCRKLVERSSLCFARDNKSHSGLTGLNPTGILIDQSPDFTPLVSPSKVYSDEELVIPESQFVAIVPNYRMVDKLKNPDAYFKFLEVVIETIKNKGLEAIFVIHDSREDFKVVEKMVSRGVKLNFITHESPRVLKYILGRSTFVVASRFHAIVSTLSQGVPCVGAGWSHKYPELFEEYDCREFLLDEIENHQATRKAIDVLAKHEARAEVELKLAQAKMRVVDRIDQMWSKVIGLIREIADSKNTKP